MTGRRKEVKQHLDDAIDEAQQANEVQLVCRLIYMKTLYFGDIPAEAA